MIPSTFLCPLTHKIMWQPVIAADGHVYEKVSIENWLRSHQTSPVTGESINSVVTPASLLEKEIEYFMLRKLLLSDDLDVCQDHRLKESKCVLDIGGNVFDLRANIREGALKTMAEFLDLIEVCFVDHPTIIIPELPLRDNFAIHALCYAVTLGSVKAINWLVNNGVDTNICLHDPCAEYLIHTICYMRDPEILTKFLSKKETQINVRNYLGMTPLHLVVENDSDDKGKILAKILLDLGADVNAIESEAGGTPLSLAAARCRNEVVELLIKQGANINSQSDIIFGDTPLHIAVKNNQIENIKLLLAAGADTKISNFNQQTPLDIAYAENKQDVIDLFLKIHKKD